MKTSVATATPNIALIKYWGNRNDELRLPVADSLSMTINHPSVEITLREADRFSVRSYETDGAEKTLTKNDIDRFKNVVTLAGNYIAGIVGKEILGMGMEAEIRSHIPPKIGLASSAAVFCCFAEALAGCIADEVSLTPEQKSIVARLGSGSAARSVFGGYSSLIAGERSALDASYAMQVADENHWMLHDIIVVPTHEEKKVGSSDGHSLAHSSPHFGARVHAIKTRRQQECIEAILAKDFEKLRAVAEEDCMDMHNVMQTSSPPLNYLSDDTHAIIKGIEVLRKEKHLPVFYTMDAGPTVHLFCTEEGRDDVLTFANNQNGCTVFETKTGPGSSLI